ncbi:uncharacterized protein LOC117177765 [Belonocnema kinseyi]|uniref:uncharacterized protein LOC117177765 n=1 Tax=Belonocnema kinseyi TaxID=2817044 RepID=UPI00143CF0FB|nr:uncharacterized protein LOC117177765 [Belonocnema kinseyi]XP_033224566.1 uncharacterized protein LOC117177765 [Belonocnema kinseyi]XP_033224567.1 uncharacterized protein LOC117177765 [Belonocnema kinseyi]
MEEIKLLREKHKLPSASDLKNKVQESLIFMKNTEEKQAHKLAEDELGIQMLTSKLSSLMEELSRERNILLEKDNTLKKYKEELESLDSEVKAVAAELQQLQMKKDNLKMIKPNAKDQRVIDQGLRKFNLLKEITGIRWNFEALEECTKGYVTNKQDYIQPFCYDSKTASGQDLSNLLWKDIQASTNRSNLDKEASKENQVQN